MKILTPSAESRASRRVRTIRMRSTSQSIVSYTGHSVNHQQRSTPYARDAGSEGASGAYAATGSSRSWTRLIVTRQAWRKHVELAFGAKLTAPRRHGAGGGSQYGTRRNVACGCFAVSLSCGTAGSGSGKHHEETCRDHQHETFPRD